jgi:FSR family fosmidomycin resistance protein-like MFS transporter
VTGAALPSIRRDLHLSYADVGLLLSAPLLVGGLVELPMGLLADRGWRRWLILVGGAGFVLSLGAVAGSRSFWMLLAAFVLFYPSSGAFVALSQANLMDRDPGRVEANMARWNFAGAVGATLGPVLVAAAALSGTGWRSAYLALAVAAAVCAVVVARLPGTAGAKQAPGQPPAAGAFSGWRVVRSLALLEASNLMLDVLTGFLAIYLVDVAHASPALAALAVGVRLAADLAGGLLLIPLLERAPGERYVRASAALLLVLYPAFLLVPGLPAKLALLALISLATAGWYPVLKAGLYSAMPGRSGTVITLASLSSLLGAAIPAAIGLLAAWMGLPAAMWWVLLSPVVLLLGSLHRRERLAPDD